MFNVSMMFVIFYVVCLPRLPETPLHLPRPPKSQKRAQRSAPLLRLNIEVKGNYLSIAERIAEVRERSAPSG